MDRRHQNKIDDAKTFNDFLYLQQKSPSPVAMQTACQDLSEQVTLATAEEGDQEINITWYSEDLIWCLGNGKGSIFEMKYLNELSCQQDSRSTWRKQKMSVKVWE